MFAAAGLALFAPSGVLRRSVGRAFGTIGPSGRDPSSRESIDGLRALDDRLLTDIGVDRASLGFALHHGHLPMQDVPRHGAGPRVGDA